MTKKSRAALELAIMLGLLIAGGFVFVGYQLAQVSEAISTHSVRK